jgi:rod shape-determining protein MreC
VLNVFKGSLTSGVRILIVCALFFFMAHRLFFFKPGILETVSSLVVYPFVRLQQRITDPIARFIENRQTHATLEKTIKTLQQEKKKLLADVVALHSALWYEKKTRAVHTFLERYKLERCPCVQIIMKQSSPYEHSFLIDYGSMHGAEVDMVAVYNNCIIGRVAHVYPYYSKVISCADPLCKIPVQCSKSRAKGIYEGTTYEYAGALRFVSHLENLVNDELVISSGEGVIFPEGLAVGNIAWFEREGLQYNVGVKPLVSLNELDYCYLVKKGVQRN